MLHAERALRHIADEFIYTCLLIPALGARVKRALSPVRLVLWAIFVISPRGDGLRS